ncbi:MAG: transaldolase family protein, partial [Anaerorhabdus sp.]
VNRMDNYGDGVLDVIDLLTMLKNANMQTKVIAASFKNTRQVHSLLVAGIQAITLPVDVVKNMMNHPGSEIAVSEFSKNWEDAYNIKKLR